MWQGRAEPNGQMEEILLLHLYNYVDAPPQKKTKT